ncbi:citrate synthase [Streptomyces sp. NPDC057638]|uniref:citrate synthase n=1 Tax=Streptomyces sp. NPDC057638 TaxID=3346190 RepID=UPI00367FFCE5
MTDHPGHGDRLTTKEAAQRLGVKPETVYAYVSRGLLTSHRSPSGRGSTFDTAEVDALAGKGRREPPGGDPLTRLRSGITLIDAGRYYFRGVDATALAQRHPYEEIADWLWTGTLRPGLRLIAPPGALSAARRALAGMPPGSGPVDRMRVAAIAAAVADPLRFDLGRDSVLDSARALIPTLVDALPPLGPPPPADAPLASRLWPRLTAREPDPPSLRALDLALALLIDHGMAASTVAVRVAASARAHPYAAVSAGLGALDGPLHGAASGLAHRMLAEVLERGSAPAVVADHLRVSHPVPGLGHRLYPGSDPRADALFAALADIPSAQATLTAAHQVAEVTARQTSLHPNVDLALAALSVASGMPSEAGETIFAVARTAGWIAHALEEYAEPPLRLRPTGPYTGPPPPQPLP